MTVRQAAPVLLDPQGVLQQPGNGAPLRARPQLLLWLSGVLAAAALALIVFVAYQTWYLSELATGTAYPLLGALAFVYIGAVLAFSYGYERGDWKQVLKLTAIVAGVTLGAVILLIVAFVLIAASSKKSWSSSSSHSSSDHDDDSAPSSPDGPRESTPYYARHDPLTDALLYGGRGPAVRTLNAPAATMCPSCGNLFEGDAERFCGNCGAPR
jgi:hypothetical protein